jgi:hypothetical protein
VRAPADPAALYIRVAPIGKRGTNLKQQFAIYLKELKMEVNWFIGQYRAMAYPKREQQ